MSSRVVSSGAHFYPPTLQAAKRSQHKQGFPENRAQSILYAMIHAPSARAVQDLKTKYEKSKAADMKIHSLESGKICRALERSMDRVENVRQETPHLKKDEEFALNYLETRWNKGDPGNYRFKARSLRVE